MKLLPSFRDGPTAGMQYSTPTHDGLRRAAASATSRRAFLQAAVALGLLTSRLPARAETTGRVVFGFLLTPAEEVFITSVVRDLQPRYRPDLGSKLISLPGNSGMQAVASVLNAPRDGASVLLNVSGAMAVLSILGKLPFDPSTALEPVAAIGHFPFAFIIGPAVPAEIRTMADYLRWAQANPGSATYGVPGRGTPTHFIGTEIARLADVNLKPVGYKGPLPLIKDVEQGNIPAAVTVVLNSHDAAAFKGVRTLAVSSSKRWPSWPEAPTLVELGLATSESIESLGFFVAAGTPAVKTAELREAIIQAVTSPASVAALQGVAMEPAPQDITYAAWVARERADWQTRVDLRHFTAES